MSIRLSRSPLSVAPAYRALEDRTSGGVALFVGRVRPDRRGRSRVAALLYEADARMAIRALRQLDSEARRKFGARRTLLWHRVGLVRVGEVAVIIGVAAPHRAAALAACGFLIDRLKRRVPIWKTDRVRPGHPPRRHRAPRGGR